MFRLVPLAAACLTMLTLPAFADAESDAIAACAKWIKRDGIATQVSPDYTVSGSGERFEVATRATVDGQANSRVICKVNKGRVTNINYG